MRDLIDQLLQRLGSGRRVAYCRLVETRGSTPQKAGAAMLVFEDGQQAGTLGGGCVEAEVKRHALAGLDKGEAEIASFQLDSDYGWDDGLICGGRMKVLIVPLAPPAPEYFAQLDRLIAAGQGFTEVVVFDGPKSGLPAPTCCLFDREAQPLATLGRALPSANLATLAQGLLRLDERPRPYARAGVSYLPVLPRCRLVVVGGGHVGQALGKLAPELDFDVTVVDDRAEYVSRERFPLARQLVHGPIDETLRELPIDSDTYCVIVTRGHNHDEEALYHLAERGAAYVGMIGSKRKIKLIFDDLETEGISREALARVHAPVGLEIGSQTVPEIAVSILAELVAHRNLGDRFSRDGHLATTSESP